MSMRLKQPELCKTNLLLKLSRDTLREKKRKAPELKFSQNKNNTKKRDLAEITQFTNFQAELLPISTQFLTRKQTKKEDKVDAKCLRLFFNE
jgi:hypothetical protein